MGKRHTLADVVEIVDFLSSMTAEQMAEAFARFEDDHGRPVPHGAEFLAIATANDQKEGRAGT